MKGYIKPCIDCEEICKQIEDLIITFLGYMNFDMIKDDVRSFWRTLQAFSMFKFSKDVLSRYYDEYMSKENKQRVTKERFIEIMNNRWK